MSRSTIATCGVVALWLALAGVRPAGARLAAGQPPPLAGPGNRGEVRALRTGKILVASRELRDPNFVETVVLLVEFDPKGGAVGFIVNRRTDVPVSRVFTGPEGLRAGRALLFLGGPVEVKNIMGLTRNASSPQDRHVVGDVYLVPSFESLERADRRRRVARPVPGVRGLLGVGRGATPARDGGGRVVGARRGRERGVRPEPRHAVGAADQADAQACRRTER